MSGDERLLHRKPHVVDALVVAWIAVWIATGVFVGFQVAQLSHLSDTLEQSSRALDQTAGGLDDLRNVPFVGSRIGHISSEVQATSTSAKRNAAASRSAITRLAWLLGVVIAVIPSALAVAIYVPIRRGRLRFASGTSTRAP